MTPGFTPSRVDSTRQFFSVSVDVWRIVGQRSERSWVESNRATSL